MWAGKLRHKISFYRYDEGRDVVGGVIPAWKFYAQAWASIRPMTGREEFADKEINTEQTHKIKCRFIRGIESTMKIRFGVRVFEVIGNPINYEERNIFLIFNAKELFDHDDIHAITDIPVVKPCDNSVGGADAMEWNLAGSFLASCNLCKG